MDRCALFVDAGYVLADGAMAVHGTRRRESVSWDYPGLLQLLGSLAVERSRLPLLRCYWYEATVEGRRSADHDTLADLPGVKLRLAKMRPGRREGVEGEIRRDLTTLARNKAVSDAMVVSAEEDLTQVISDVQDMGMRVILLNIAIDGDLTVSRTLQQECDDFAEISSAHLRPYVELISGAEPPRANEREGTLVALRPNLNGNGHGPAGGQPAPYGQPPARQPSADLAHEQQAAPVYGVPSEAPVPQEQPARQDQQPVPYAAGPQQEPVQQEPDQQEPAHRDPGQQVSPEAAAEQPAVPGYAALGEPGYPVPGEYGASEEHGAPGEYGAAGEYGAPGEYGAAGEPEEYGAAADYGAVPDFRPAAYDPAATAQRSPQDQPLLRQDALPAAPDQAAAPDAQQHIRQDYPTHPGSARPELAAHGELPPRPEPTAPRTDLYAAPVAVPAEDRPAERLSARPRQGADLSGYNPGAVREQFHPGAGNHEPMAADGDRYQPVPIAAPASSAQIRRLPARGGGQPSLGQPSLGQPSLGQPPPGQPPAGPPAVGSQAPGPSVAPLPGPYPPGLPAGGGMTPGAGTEPVAGPPSGGQPMAPAAPIDQGAAGQGALGQSAPGQAGPVAPGYSGPRGAAYPNQFPDGPPLTGQAGPLVPAGAPIPPAAPGQAGPGGQLGPGGLAGPASMAGQGDGGARQQGAPVPGPHPPLSQVPPAGPAPHDAGGPGGPGGPVGPGGPLGPVGPVGYSGGQQAAVSLADAVQSAHEEGQAFGDSVARDAPALWLEAVLARKPRMPSDLEARLLQGSALPIDFLLHDEVRHALRRGFWDALERSRR